MKPREKNPLAVALGRLSGRHLTKKQRSDKARKAARARWDRVKAS